jgi:ribose transport system permease protein
MEIEAKIEKKVHRSLLKGSVLRLIFTKLLSSQAGGIIFALIIICLIIAFFNPAFLSKYNLTTLILGFSFISIVAFGETMVLISGEIDLSIGAIAGLSGIGAAWLMVNSGLSPILAIVAGLAMGAACGLVNGFLITKIKLNSFIVTLGTMEAFSGLIMVITKGWAIVRIPESIFFLGRGQVLGAPIPVVIMIAILFYLSLVLKSTVFGQRVYLVGGSEIAARVVGINVEKMKITIFTLSGILSATAGVLMVARLTSGQPTVGQYWLLPSIAAAVIGGTSLTGGRGGLIGTLAGAAIMGVLQNAIAILGISPYWERTIIGIVVVLAVTMDVIRQRTGYLKMIGRMIKR